MSSALATRVGRPTLFLFSILVIMAIPTILITGMGWKSAGTLASLSAISGIINAMSQGWRTLRWGTAFTAIAIFFAVLGAASPWASAAVMLAVGVVFGLANARGLSASNLMLPMVVAATIGTPPTITHNVPADALISAGITIFSMLIAGGIAIVFTHKKHTTLPDYPKYSTKVNGVYTFNVTLLWTIIGYVTSQHHMQVQGMWMALTVVLIVHPYIDASVRKGLERAGGTILGFLIALGVATAITATGLYALVGLVFIELAFLAMANAKNSYWIFVMFLTPGIVLLSGPASEVTQYADWRLLVTLIAVAACLLLLGMERLLFYKGSLNKEPEKASQPLS